MAESSSLVSSARPNQNVDARMSGADCELFANKNGVTVVPINQANRNLRISAFRLRINYPKRLLRWQWGWGGLAGRVRCSGDLARARGTSFVHGWR